MILGYPGDTGDTGGICDNKDIFMTDVLAYPAFDTSRYPCYLDVNARSLQ